MKKMISAVALVIVMAILASSCGTTKTCPAYSSNQTEQTDGQNS